jgi:hypothetical protein
MAERFTGFWEDDSTVATTVGPMLIDDLLERLRVRLQETAPGTVVRIDLIAWDGEP